MEMDRRVKLNTSVFFLLLLSVSCFSVSSLAKTNTKENPFTAKASLIRYWNKQITNNLPKPAFLLSKSSPLSAVESSFFVKLAAERTLPSHLTAFCSSANLFCNFPASASVVSKATRQSHNSDANFASYTNKNFASYGTSKLGGADTFKTYSDGLNFASGSFSRYSRSSTRHQEGFASYVSDGNVASSNFTSYAPGSTGGSGTFNSYMARVNVPDLRFTSYTSDGNNHELTFTSYVDDTNSGNQGFTSYAKNGNSENVGFSSYGTTSNVIGSAFTGYGELGNAANDSFKTYSSNANNPSNNFRNYGAGGNGGTDSFSSYRDSANAGTDTFQSYGRKSSSGKTSFSNYGKSFNVGLDTFKEYARLAKDQIVGFKIYGVNNTFKDYAKKGVTFGQYTKSNQGDEKVKLSGKTINNHVEEGKFFRESMLKEGLVMKMPDIHDWMPKRSFLPRNIVSKLPFSTQEVIELKQIFQAENNSALDHVLVNTLAECERAPSKGETKRCVGSIEDMIDFAVSVLGHDVTVQTTENVEGSKKDVMIGKVNKINRGRVTRSVSCHQSLYPYLLYYCHSVPKVRVYEADILHVVSKVKINHGVAICHLDTSAWSPGHGAFMALGAGPGRIEVCHWIFENDMTWMIADH